MKKYLILFLSVFFFFNITIANEIDGVYRQTIMNRGYLYDESGFFETIRKNDIDTMNIFFKAGMNPDITFAGTPAPMQALFLNKNKALDLLLTKGANVETQVPPLWVSVKSQNLLSYAIKRKNIEAVEILIKHGVDVNKPFNKKTPLERAKKSKQDKIVDLLIKNGAIK